MRGQHTGLPQSQSRQQAGYDEMQLLRHQLMFKQLQELQRQQQIRQSGEESKQHDLMRQMSSASKQIGSCPLPAVVNGVPLHDSPNFTWQGEYAGSDLKMPRNSQLLMSGNTSLAQRASHSMHETSNGFSVLPQEQQALQPFGFVSQQHDQSLYGLPVSGNRGWLSQYSQLHEVSQPAPLSEAMSKGGANIPYNSFRSSSGLYHQQTSGLQDAHVACRQDFPEKRFYGQPPADSLKNSIPTNFQQTNSLERNTSIQDFDSRQEQSYCQENYQEKSSHGMTPSSVSLDPTEQKILFSSDDDTNWDVFGMTSNMGAGAYPNGNSLDGNSFPSFHGGSWSALMQSAVAEASNSDAGFKEEWSGLSLQKNDIPSRNHKPTLYDTPKQQANWFTNSLQDTTSEALGPNSSLRNGNASIDDKKITASQQFSAKICSDPTKSAQDASHYGSMQQSLHFSSPNVHSPLHQKQNMPSCTPDIQVSSKGDGWVLNDLQTSHSKATFKVSDHGHSQVNDSPGTMFADKSHGNTMWNNDPDRASSSVPNSADGVEAIKSNLSSPHMQIALGNSSISDKGLNSYGFNEHDYDHGKQLLLNSSSQSTTGKENLGNNPLLSNKKSQAWESISSNVDKVSGNMYDRDQPRSSQKELSNDSSYVSVHSHPDSSDSGGVARAGVETHSFAHINQHFQGHAGKKGLVPRKFQYHPMGNISFVSEVNDPRKRSLFAQEQHQLSPGDSKNYQGHLQLAATSCTADTDKGCVRDAERMARGPSQTHSKDLQVSHFLGGSSVLSPQSMRTGQPSQNMLELINKVDQSRMGDASKNYAGQTLPSQGMESKAPDGHISNPQFNQAPPLQGFRLQLGPPFARQSASNNAVHFSPQAVADNNIQPSYPDEEKIGAWPNSSPSDQSMHRIHNAPKTGEFDGKPIVPQETGKETSESSTLSKHMGSMPTCQSNAQNQASNQHIFGASVNILNDRPPLSQFEESKRQQSSDSHIGNVTNGSSQTALSDLPPGISPFRFAPPQDIRSSLGLQSGPVMSHSGSLNIEPNARSSSQQIPDPRVSLRTSMGQKVGFSGNFHHAWNNFSAQHMSNNFLPKGMPNSLQQLGSSSLRTPPWIPTKFDDQENKLQSSSTGGAYTVKEEQSAQDNSTVHLASAKVGLSSHGQDSSVNRISDGSSSMPSHAMVKMGQKESSNNEPGSSSNIQRVHQTPNHDAHHGFVFRLSDDPNGNYSLLQQVEALKALEADQSNRFGKRFKGNDVGVESQSQCFTGKAPQNLKPMDGNNAGARCPGSPAENELSAVVQPGPFPSNSRMLSFSSAATDDQKTSKITSDPESDSSCQDLSMCKPSDSLNNSQPIAVASTISLVRGMEDAQVRSQMTSSWVEPHGLLKGNHASPIHDENENLQPNSEVASDRHLNSCVPESTCSLSDAASFWNEPSISASRDTSLVVHELPKEVLDPNLVQRSVRRKRVELLPWHREVVEGSHWRHSIRMAERDWAQATDRLFEKEEGEAEFIDYGSSIIRSRKRLRLTIHLMQNLLPPLPATILIEPASAVYELVTFFVAKLGLGDSCSLASSLANGVGTSLAVENVRVGRFKGYEISGDQHFLKIVKSFVGRMEKLESDVLRFERRASVLDVRVECQDLERFSIINRFAKFHGRSQAEGIESSSTSETSRRTFPQRFVTAVTVPGNPPEGLVCLSL